MVSGSVVNGGLEHLYPGTVSEVTCNRTSKPFVYDPVGLFRALVPEIDGNEEGVCSTRRTWDYRRFLRHPGLTLQGCNGWDSTSTGSTDNHSEKRGGVGRESGGRRRLEVTGPPFRDCTYPSPFF